MAKADTIFNSQYREYRPCPLSIRQKGGAVVDGIDCGGPNHVIGS